MDPSFAIDGGSILYHTYDQRSVRSIRPADGHTEELVRTFSIQPRLYEEPLALRKVTALDIPYVNQVYDTPDWFNRPFSLRANDRRMLLAHYRALPHGRGGVRSRPGMSTYGTIRVRPLQVQRIRLCVAGLRPEQPARPGGFGYMWASGSPHSMMASYYNRHGISASTLDSPSLQTAVNEVEAGRPYSSAWT